MAPSIVWSALQRATPDAPRLRVLDPMTGSGTTIATARVLGHEAFGTDTDPLAVLIARAWSTDFEQGALRDAAATVLKRARSVARTLPQSAAYPLDAGDETRAFIRYWFDERARRHLASLANSIRRIRREDMRILLWCAFSRLLIVKSQGASLAMDVAHSRPHKVYARAPLNVFDGYERAIDLIASRSPFTDSETRPAATVKCGDARRLSLPDSSIDLVMTSPPYLNAIDYLRGHKFSLVWMGHAVEALREIRATNVGTEVSVPLSDVASFVQAVMQEMGTVELLRPREAGMVRRYVFDMNAVMGEIARVLVPNGRAVLVVGDSTLRRVFVKNSRALELLGLRNGLEVLESRRRPLPMDRRYLPPPGAKGSGRRLAARMREEVILTFRKPAGPNEGRGGVPA
jgi:SAM-dependent methyltransferase